MQRPGRLSCSVMLDGPAVREEFAMGIQVMATNLSSMRGLGKRDVRGL